MPLETFNSDDPKLRENINIKLLSKAKYDPNNVRFLGITNEDNTSFSLEGPIEGNNYYREDINSIYHMKSNYKFLLYSNGKGWGMTNYNIEKFNALSKQFVSKLCTAIAQAHNDLAGPKLEELASKNLNSEVRLSAKSYAAMMQRLASLEQKIHTQEERIAQSASASLSEIAPPPYAELYEPPNYSMT